jgi:uncharacterized membrane protein YfcA
MTFSGLEMAVLAMIGTVAGLLGGLLGIGGSIVMIPGMLLLFGARHGQEGQHLYQAAAMIVNFFVAGSSAIKHYKAGAMVWPTLKSMIPLAICGSIAGVWISNLPTFSGSGTIWLSRLFGLFMLYVAVYNTWRMVRGPRAQDTVTPPAERIGGWRAGLVGIPAGLSGGLLGIGGGVVNVPLQQIALRIPLQRSIANSSACIVFVAAFGAVAKNLTLSQHFGPNGQPFAAVQSLTIAALLIPTAFVGAYVGAHLTHTVPLGWLRVAFACLMLYAGIRLITRQLPAAQIRPAGRALVFSSSLTGRENVDAAGGNAGPGIEDWECGAYVPVLRTALRLPSAANLQA